MRIEGIRRETERLRKKIGILPKIRRFRGRRVVREGWKWADWSTLPDHYIPLMINPNSTPHDWYRDYRALMEELRDPTYGNALCSRCAINEAQEAKKEIDRDAKYREENGGEVGKEERKREAKWRLFNERGGAKDRTCDVINYFNCPYGNERGQLVEKGTAADDVWEHTKWYDTHWNRNHTLPGESSSEWYHYDEPPILDVTDFDDITKAIEDGRFDKIVKEHERYMKEFKYEIWAL